jgi:serine kinase of HPr protein (carbohydrate metabolism regulator)
VTDRIRIHGTAVAIGGDAVLLRGPSGAGKSDLALRLIDGGARLVADDQAELQRATKHVLVRSPTAIAGLLEVRGIGIVRVEPLVEAPLALLVDLVSPEEVERLPEPSLEQVLGLAIRLITLAPFEASAAAKIRIAVRELSASPLLAVIG